MYPPVNKNMIFMLKNMLIKFFFLQSTKHAKITFIWNFAHYRKSVFQLVSIQQIWIIKFLNNQFHEKILKYLLRSRICGFISRSTSSGHDFIQTSFTSKSFLFVLFQFFIQFSLFTFSFFLGFAFSLFTFGFFILLKKYMNVKN